MVGFPYGYSPGETRNELPRDVTDAGHPRTPNVSPDLSL